MEDERIIALYTQRCEEAIRETKKKYGPYCRTIARNILSDELDVEARHLFIRRYWYLDSIGELADRFYMSESKVKSMLFRTRNKLRSYLEKEGIRL